ncbi:glycosyltransferase [Shewanella waksmanii]|uniref:glycosyltransferase n=1 Tax=Shewanella waksmanii TaxID=213783 RepID=UPI00373702D1
MLVTVYLITQNRSQLLERAIKSVIQQDYKEIELIVVDDASNDNTPETIAALQKDYDFIYLRNDVVRGACFSRNRAIQKATGYFITGLDDDDYFLPERVRQLVDAYEEQYAFVCSNVKELMKNGTMIPRSYGFQSGEFGLNEMLHHNLAGNQVFTTKKKFEQIGGFDVEMPAFQDYDTWVRLLKNNPKALKIAATNYILETEHGGVRISSSVNRKFQGFEKFKYKHRDLLKPSHLKSLTILEAKVSGSGFGFIDLIKSISPRNYKSALSLYIQRNMSWLKTRVDNLKG